MKAKAALSLLVLALAVFVFALTLPQLAAAVFDFLVFNFVYLLIGAWVTFAAAGAAAWLYASRWKNWGG